MSIKKEPPFLIYIMIRFKALILGVVGGLAGAMLGLGSWALELEEDTGLEWLFHQRGVVTPPDEIAVIAIDKRSADRLGLPNDTSQWPRRLHTELVSRLSGAGVTSVAFDILFRVPRDPVEDNAFAAAIDNANNVVLFEFMKKELASDDLTDQSMTIRRRIPPIPPLADAAAALAPFPLPKVPLKVSQFWSFAADAGDAPTLPTATLQLYTLEAYDDFRRLLKQHAPQQLNELPPNRAAMLQQKQLVPFMHQLKRLFDQRPDLLDTLTTAARQSLTLQHRETLLAMLRIYGPQHSHYLNYYGPPRTIKTIPYHQIIQSDANPEWASQLASLKGKIVLVGYSAELQWEQKDGFYSVFSREDGLDISGVEIAATAVANLLQGRIVEPLTPAVHFVLLLLWGMTIALVACRLPAVVATATTVALSATYFAVALYQFSTINLWLPLLLPLLIQGPLILFAGIIWKHLETQRERHNIHQAFRHYLPEQVIDAMTRDGATLAPGGELRYAVCLFTDAAQYTRLSEQLAPDALGALMNRYYETIFAAVHSHNGIISDVVGDAAMALWPSDRSDPRLHNAACRAAIALIKGVERFNLEERRHQLPTRIGMHCGEVLLGNVGAAGRLEYRATGDVVNTTSRIEGMNKHFGTRLIVSEALLSDQNEFLHRPLGAFVLAGKSQPIKLHELICLVEEATAQQQQLCREFREALSLFQLGKWREAAVLFNQIASGHQDQASLYYRDLCLQHQAHPPELPWNGIVQVAAK